MKLAIVTQYYPPETGAPQNRLSDLAERLAVRGHDVQVLTALPNYPGTEVHSEYRGRENSVELMNGVRVARVGLYVPKNRRFTHRLLGYFSFAWNAWRNGARLLHQPDIVMLESPPLSVAVAAVPLARKWKARLVANISDLWPGAVAEMGMVTFRPALWAAYRMEAWMYRNSDLITGQTDGIVEDIQGRFPGMATAVYPNGVDLRLYDQPLHRAEVRREFGWMDDQFVVGYTGNLGYPQALTQIIEAAWRLRDQPRIHWALFGDGPCRDQLAEAIANRGISTARIYPRQPREKMPHIQAALDAGVVTLAKDRIFEGARPSKMFEVMAAARPLVLCARGEAVRVMRRTHGGAVCVVVPPEEPEHLAAAVRQLAGAPAIGREMGLRGREFVRREFDREKIADQMERNLEQTVRGGAGN